MSLAVNEGSRKITLAFCINALATHIQSDLYKIPKALSKCKKPNAKKQILSYALYCYTKQKQETQISLPTTTKNKSARIQEKQKKENCKIVK